VVFLGRVVNLARGDSAGIEHPRRLKSGLPYERSWVAAELSCKAGCVQTEPFCRNCLRWGSFIAEPPSLVSLFDHLVGAREQ
jgi:hypothetical protein